MGIFSRFNDIIQSNINAILEKAEDPEKLVRLMIQEMEDTLVEVRTSAARAIADKKQLTRRLDAYRAEAAEWQDKAELAVRKGRDDLAKAALAERANVDSAANSLSEQYSKLEEDLEKLNHDIGRLEAKLADAKAKQKALLMRHNAAEKRLKVRKHTHTNHIDDALVRFEQFERKMDDMEGRVEAYDLGRAKDLHAQFVDLESNEAVEKELAELKTRVGAE